MELSAVMTESCFPFERSSMHMHLLGLVDFDAALVLQEWLAYEMGERKGLGCDVLICEHPPLITVGREGHANDITWHREKLQSNSLEVRYVSRGGGTVFHMPGQLAIYPIFPLLRSEFGLTEFVTLLEKTVRDVAEEFHLMSHSDENQAGVFTKLGQLASVGVSLNRGVTQHGIYLNVSPDLTLHREILFPGRSISATSLAALCLRNLRMSSVRESLIRNLAKNLGYKEYHAQTGHRLLKRKKRVVIHHA